MKHINPKDAKSQANLLTLADVRSEISMTATLTDIRRRDLLSALKTFGTWAGLSLTSIPATHSDVRKIWETLSPGGLSVSKGRIANVSSGLNRALQLVNAPNVRKIQPLGEEWKNLFSVIENDGDRHALSKFGRYCTSRNLVPSGINQAVSASYLDYLENATSVSKPREKHQAFCRAWNRLVSKTRRNDLLKLDVPKYAKRYGLARETFTEPLQTEVQEYRDYLTCTDPLADKAPLKPLRAVSADARVK